MYPFIEFYNINIYVFGLTMTISFFLFIWMLKKISSRFGINQSFFQNRILIYFLSTLFFSRLFYVIANWNNFKYIKSPIEFFIMSDYNFSLIGAMFGFLLVLYFNIRIYNLKSGKYLDAVVLSFLFISIIAYIGSFFGGQVYGRETNLGIEILYTSPFSPIPYKVPIFPLPIVYALTSFVIFSVLYMIAMFVKIRGIIGYIGIILFSGMLMILETFTGKYDYFKLKYNVNFTQIGAILFILYSFYGLYKIYRNYKIKED